MITLAFDKELIKTLLDALEIAMAWHKHDMRFKEAHKHISDIVL
jgi:hypothetical protein